uniref:Peptidase metallopeptidase domain-containing protein n=1 Tax=Biomphalaria glabrata TaxID=6526 RepID=A0A2C9LXL6_BIOGL
MPQATTRQLISDAFRVWSDATPLSFKEVVDSSADIMIQFASQYHSDGYPFDGKGMVLGHAFFPGNDKGGDTHFDDDENWTANSTDVKRYTLKLTPLAERRTLKLTPLAERRTLKLTPIAERRTLKLTPLAERRTLKLTPLAERRTLKLTPLAERRTLKLTPLAD